MPISDMVTNPRALVGSDAVQVIDSHTAGEPTRVVIDGAPSLSGRSLREKVADFRRRHDGFRSALTNEPRGNDAIVGALLLKPNSPDSTAGIIFFNNVGYLGMCVHGTIGVVVTLAFLGRISPGTHVFETPVGRVRATLHDDNTVSVRQVPSFRYREGVALELEGHGPIVGDVAWGGNWFFLAKNSPIPLERKRIPELTALGNRIRLALRESEITGVGGQEVDHVELFSSETDEPGNDSKNFVLCPGDAYDRSPCGTGTSAKLACLAADGVLAPGQVWRQESIIGSSFTGQYEWLSAGRIQPTITGSAWVNGESKLLLNDRDPFCCGIPQ